MKGGNEGQPGMDILLDLGYVALTAAMFVATAWLVSFCASLLSDKGERS